MFFYLQGMNPTILNTQDFSKYANLKPAANT
jgi:hypothetical protein